MIILDVETTGLDPQKNALLSIGAIEFENPENIFYGECRIHEGAEVTDYALQLNGFTKELITSDGLQLIQDLVRRLFEWCKPIKDKTLCGENISFDIGFLKKAFERCGVEWIFGHRSVDLHAISYMLHRNAGKLELDRERSALSLDHTLKFVGLPAEPKPHIALMGAKLEAEAFSRLVHKKPLLKEFSHYSMP